MPPGGAYFRRAVLRAAGVRYELGRRVGGGGLADVHAARAVGGGSDRTVCVKRSVAGANAEGRRALREEARLLSCVRHAGVPTLLAAGEDPPSRPFFVLEYIDGADLRQLSYHLARRRERLPDAVAVHLACALLRALAAVERALPGFVHRDVTPHNVLLSSDGEVKLCDFGIALARDRPEPPHPEHVKGKVGYMSPEQIRGHALDARSDLFALGVVLYELLCGERPWDALGGVRELRAVIESPPVPLRRRRPRIDPALGAAVDRLVTREPSARFPSADETLRAVAPFGAGELGPPLLAAIVRSAFAREK